MESLIVKATQSWETYT